MILAFANANYHVEPMADNQAMHWPRDKGYEIDMYDDEAMAMHWPRDELIIRKLELSY